MNRFYYHQIIPVLVTFTLARAEDYQSIQPFFESHCIQCHGEEKQKGKVRLDNISHIDAGLWTDVFEVLASEEMPPDDEPQPSEIEKQKVLDFVLAYAQSGKEAESTGFRRLNKREYGNTVRDLLGLENGIYDPGNSIYEDEVGKGFDTEAEALVISNELLLEYLEAAKTSLRLALFSSEVLQPESRVIDVATQRIRGGSARYVTFNSKHAILRVGGKAKIYDGGVDKVMESPGRYKITVTASSVDRDYYPVRFQPEEGPLELGIGVIAEKEESVTSGGTLLQTFELEEGGEQTFEFETWIDKDHYPYLAFLNASSKPITQIRSNIRRRKLPASAMSPYRGPGIRITEYRIEGPYNDEWPPKAFQVTYDQATIPDLENRAERTDTVMRFAKRAFRRSVDRDEIEPYLKYWDEQYEATRDWHESTIRTFAAMMASLDFLYLPSDTIPSQTGSAGDSIEPGEAPRLDAYALANRLSYFFWSTMPDSELFALADSQEILKSEVLVDQVERLLSDPRSLRFSHSFADQWLSLDILGTMPPDGKGEFREYYRDNLEPSMRAETRKFFHHILEENLSVRDFLDSNYTFLNDGLAKLYGVPHEGGEELVKVSLPEDSIRGGLLGQGGILALTSNGVETSPIVRGHWILDELLGTPPPPAPKEVPALVPDLNGIDTVRELLEMHRSDASCVECHRQMDPLGMALEAFDPIGRFRTDYSETQEVTTYGTYLGRDFEDVRELKRILLTQARPFSRNLTIKLAEYAKGRTLGLSDFAEIEEIVEESAANDYRLRDLMIRVATSELMTHR
ncbi:MAG: DUF1592 domain-containing protein [Verrucomicrobiales bacterium]|nr:DUF1592 domain-containing protein [Verrucomicrobiales bacterium]